MNELMSNDLSSIHPVNFFRDSVLKSPDIGNPEIYPILQQIQHMSTKDTHQMLHIEEILKDFIINNVSNLSNTFIIKLLEDNIGKDEMAYLVDFYGDFDLKSYLFDTISKNALYSYDPESICNIIESNIIFTLNQFVQFYVIYKLVYIKEGVDLYKTLYKETYGENPDGTMREQDKYVFCCSIMNSMIENLVPDITDCCNSLKSTIENIKLLYPRR